MYRALRKESMRRVLPRIIALAVAAVILLALSAGGLLKLASGPKEISSLSEEQLKGSYVTFDASEIIVAFATLSSSGDSGSKTVETYYLLPFGENRYLAVMDAKEHHKNVIDRAMDQSHEYYLGDLETLTKLGNLRGTVVDLDEDMLKYMSDTIDNYQLPGYEEGRDSQRLLIPLQVNLDKVGFLSGKVAVILGICGLVCLLAMIAQIVIVQCGVYQRRVRALVGDEDDAYEEAVQIERIRVGKYVWYAKGPGSRALKTSDLIWGYAMPEPMVVSKYRWPVAVYDMEQNMTQLQFMEQKHCQDFLDAVADQGHPFVKGYTSDLADQFQNHFPAFVRDAEKNK